MNEIVYETNMLTFLPFNMLIEQFGKCKNTVTNSEMNGHVHVRAV